MRIDERRGEPVTDRPGDRPDRSGVAPAGAAEWDERYGAADRIWSGAVNGALTVEVADLTPGRALDVGCGEGADAVWLARRGWELVAIDVSAVALERGRAAARQAGVGAGVTWVHAGLGEAPEDAGPFDLVTAQYPALRRTADHAAERSLIDAVGPGGHLVVVHHVLDEAATARAREHGFDPDAFIGPRDVASRLGDGWSVLVLEERPRVLEPAGVAHHADDVVLHARRH